MAITLEETLQTRDSAAKAKGDRFMHCLVKEDLDKDGLTFTRERPEPACRLDEVKIRVLSTAVCGTDKSIYTSAQSEGIRNEMKRYLTESIYTPIVVGHEFCGIVEEIGEGVKRASLEAPEHMRIEVGDYVTAEMHLSCGHCLLCRTGNEHICTSVRVKGVHLDGCFARAVSVPYKNVILLGKGGDTSVIPPKIGALLDAFGNAVHTVSEADVRGKSVAILGAGPLGLMAALLCKDFGASRIYLTEAADVDRRFKLADEFGVQYCFDVGKGASELYSAVEKYETTANGVDVVLEMSGSPTAYTDAFKIVRNGGKVILLGIARKPLNNFDIANGVIWKGVTVQGIFGRRMFDTWEMMLQLLKANNNGLQERMDKIICARTYSLEEYKTAFELVVSGKEMKLVFTP
ncbi:MAG: alcohol dehydrogenase catalytic domain-containing protein [Candidatus Obscuribacter sp.]|nr:alcohol dehydrogenase catalytic domain-containing protein [Candidatus Obscuribacter sp.]MBP6349022.1 alcohol dehydrogenase catalytic domain-containing protein [Candidatus Obscuribacter sp.]MBP6591794.1 alcohol dehydrogenase catalytic domain-containing protein [Candidatus Obscuribacter sp.]MBP7575972.1 alcohol dehydrogenase catalytic domain-containing protein [Candidatus Obscuribacter sp.]